MKYIKLYNDAWLQVPQTLIYDTEGLLIIVTDNILFPHSLSYIKPNPAQVIRLISVSPNGKITRHSYHPLKMESPELFQVYLALVKKNCRRLTKILKDHA